MTIISHYSHLSVFTLTSAKQAVSESNLKWFEEQNNEYNNDYDMKRLNDKCVSAWKKEEHEY